MSSPIISVKDLCVGWDFVPTSSGFSIDLRSGIHCIVGPNGVGKSTLLRTLAGIIPPISGSIQRRGRTGYLGHNLGIYNQLTLRQNIQTWSSLLGYSESEHRRINDLLELIDAKDLLDKLPTQFSKGQFQKAGIVRSFIGSPEIIILDEPTSGLDPISKGKVQDILVEYSKEHCIIVSSHDINEVARIASNIIQLQKNAHIRVLDSNRIYLSDTTRSVDHKVGILLKEEDIEKIKSIFVDRKYDLNKSGWIYVSLNEGEILGDLLKLILGADISLLSVDDSSFVRSLYEEEKHAI